jgi:transcription elongation GreA/GreB family factor
MQYSRTARGKPNIRISTADHARLSALANTIAAHNPDISDELLAELDRARLIPDDDVSTDIVQMGTTVTFKTDSGDTKTVTLVFPADADISEGKISILTPIGTALLGLSAGQSITWIARDGQQHELSVLVVDQPPRKSQW